MTRTYTALVIALEYFIALTNLTCNWKNIKCTMSSKRLKKIASCYCKNKVEGPESVGMLRGESEQLYCTTIVVPDQSLI